eukprot:s13_g33.t1
MAQSFVSISADSPKNGEKRVMGCGASAKVCPLVTDVTGSWSKEKWTDLMGAPSVCPEQHFDADEVVSTPTNIKGEARSLRARRVALGSRHTPQPPELAIFGLGPGVAQSIRSWQRRHQEDEGGEKGGEREEGEKEKKKFRKVVEKKPESFEAKVDNKRQRDFVEDVEDVDVPKAHGSATRAVLMLKERKKNFLEVPTPRFGRSAVPPLPPRYRVSTEESTEGSEEWTQQLA